MGGGRQAGCGIRWFGGMGERWKIDGRRRGACGPGMPGPYGVAEGCAGAGRKVSGCGVISGHLCRGRRPRRAAEGSRPLPTVWGETGWQSSNGWLWKVCGPGMPGPYRVVN